MKKLCRDRRGNVLAIAGATIPLVVGAAGLATDTIQWVTWKRELQRQADSAAFAGVLAQVQRASVSTAVDRDITKNNNHKVTLLSGYPLVEYPSTTLVGASDAVRVTLAIQKRLAFSSFFMSSAPIIRTSGTAALVDDGEYCARALNKNAVSSIIISGSSNVALGCKAISNGSACPSVEVNGTAYNFSTTGVAGAGCLPSSIRGTNSTDLDPYHIPLPDPYDDKYSTTIPDPSTCKNFNQQIYESTATGTGQDRVVTNKIRAGCYSSFQISGGETYEFDPGVYYLNSADFDIQGNAKLIGSGVTIILTGSDPGSLKVNGDATVRLSAPTSGDYDKMLFIQAENAETDNLNVVNGNSNSKYDGAIYFPNGKVKFTGSSGSATKCVMVIGYTIEFDGNANLQNDVVGCVANTLTKGKIVRLIG